MNKDIRSEGQMQSSDSHPISAHCGTGRGHAGRGHHTGGQSHPRRRWGHHARRRPIAAHRGHSWRRRGTVVLLLIVVLVPSWWRWRWWGLAAGRHRVDLLAVVGGGGGWGESEKNLREIQIMFYVQLPLLPTFSFLRRLTPLGHIYPTMRRHIQY